MRRIVTKINQLFAELSGWLLTLITFLLVLNLLTRLFGVDVEALLQLTTFVFLAVIYLGLAHSEEHDDHIKVSVLISRAPQRLRKIMNIFNYTLAVIVGAILTYAAADSVIEAYISNETVPGTSPLPTSPVKSIIFIGLLFFSLQAAIHLVKFIRSKV